MAIVKASAKAENYPRVLFGETPWDWGWRWWQGQLVPVSKGRKRGESRELDRSNTREGFITRAGFSYPVWSHTLPQGEAIWLGWCLTWSLHRCKVENCAQVTDGMSDEPVELFHIGTISWGPKIFSLMHLELSSSHRLTLHYDLLMVPGLVLQIS